MKNTQTTWTTKTKTTTTFSLQNGFSQHHIIWNLNILLFISYKIYCSVKQKKLNVVCTRVSVNTILVLHPSLLIQSFLSNIKPILDIYLNITRQGSNYTFIYVYIVVPLHIMIDFALSCIKMDYIICQIAV